MKIKSTVNFCFIIMLVLGLIHGAFASNTPAVGAAIAGSNIDMTNGYQTVTASYEDVNGQTSLDNPYFFLT